jgi:flagellar assembly protein FliH
MSSSPSRSRAAATAAAEAGVEPASVPPFQPFPYDSIPAGAIARMAMMEMDGLAADGMSSRGADRDAPDAAVRQAQVAVARQEGQAEARKTFDDQLARERAGLGIVLAQFTRDRAIYFQKVEAEVVQLALSIARKILHRESQLDPLLLAGIVRVALEKIDGATGVVLRVHPQNAATWRPYLTTRLEPSDLPEIVEDPAQELDRCTLETSMGTAVVGMEVQLKEIEQGLMDLLAARPGASS